MLQSLLYHKLTTHVPNNVVSASESRLVKQCVIGGDIIHGRGIEVKVTTWTLAGDGALCLPCGKRNKLAVGRNRPILEVKSTHRPSFLLNNCFDQSLLP